MKDIHPDRIEMEPAMKLTLALWFVPVTLLTIGLIAARYQLNARDTARRRRHQAEAAAEPALPSLGEVA